MNQRLQVWITRGFWQTVILLQAKTPLRPDAICNVFPRFVNMIHFHVSREWMRVKEFFAVVDLSFHLAIQLFSSKDILTFTNYTLSESL